MTDMLTAEEIKEIRGAYGLTQKSFASLLGIGAASIVRYEQGVRPSKANANLIRAARHPQFMAECLERDGQLIPEKQRQQASRIVYALVSLDSEEAGSASEFGKWKEPSVNKMTEMYHYTLQQEVLNEQAANLACDLMNYLMLHHIDANDKSNPISILLYQLLELKRFLITEEANDDDALERIRGHLFYMKDFITQLSEAGKVA